MAIEKTTRKSKYKTSTQYKTLLKLVLISVIQLIFSMKLQILHIENSSLWIIIWILMAFFCTPSKSSPIDFFSLTIVSGLCVSAAFPH